MGDMAMASSDAHGNAMSGPGEGVERYDDAVDKLLPFDVAVVPAMVGLASDLPDFPMGQVLAGYLSLTSTDAPDLTWARTSLETLGTLEVNDREAAHRDVLSTWLGGDWHGAARQLDELLIQWPSDMLALIVGHQLDFYLGDAQNLRDRVGRSLHAVDPAHPHSGYVHGMYAFGLEEAGHYEAAEAHGMAALERNPADVWAVHAVVHTYEMRGRVDDGIRFLRGRQPDWTGDNLFTTHNWWHYALYLLEAGENEQALGVYDGHIHNAESTGVPLEMLDASALLWRLALDGVDTGGRFGPLAESWATRTTAEPWYVFNDLHAVMAFAGAGRFDDAAQVIDRLDRYVATPTATTTTATPSNVAMTAEVGLPACRAVVASAQGRDSAVIDELAPIRTVLQHAGGSHAQRDALQRTLLESAIRAGRHDLAEALLSERLGLRETSVYSLRRWAEVLRQRGEADEAADVDGRADDHAARFAAAAAM